MIHSSCKSRGWSKCRTLEYLTLCSNPRGRDVLVRWYCTTSNLHSHCKPYTSATAASSGSVLQSTQWTEQGKCIALHASTYYSRLSNLSLAVLQLKGPGPVAKKKRRVVAVYSFVLSDGPNPTEARVAVAQQGGGIKIIRYTYLVATLLLIYIVSGVSSFSKKDAHF